MSAEAPRLPVYLDHHATTPIDPRVLAAMQPYLEGKFGNASSASHRYGWVAEEAVERARAQVARLIGAGPQEIVFTSGATESNNLALKGVAEAYGLTRAQRFFLESLAARPLDEASAICPPRYGAIDWALLKEEGAAAALPGRGDHLVTVATEHKAVLDAMAHLSREGFRVSVLPVEANGLLDLEVLERAIEPSTLLVSVMMANNEIGVLQPIAEIGARCRARGVFFHTDATQAAGTVPVNVEAQKIDLLSLSAHKLYGPKGVGALYVRRKGPRVQLEPQLHGGGHERGMRSGTLNVPGIVGLGAAAELVGQELELERARLLRLRQRLLEGLRAELDVVEINGDERERLPGNLHVSFRWVEGEALMTAMRDLAVSSGAACTSLSREPSHVLKALGLAPERAHSSIRFSLGRFTTEEEVERATRIVVEKVQRLREISPRWHEARAGLKGPADRHA